MNWVGFDNLNFVYFNGSDSRLDMVNDFIVTYTMIDSVSFKLKL